MSKQSLESFLQQISQDATFTAALKQEFGQPEGGIPLEKVAEFAARHGYTFSLQELEGELDEAQLDAVSGGAYDAFLKIDGIDGESYSLSYDLNTTRTLGTFSSRLFLKIE